MNVLVDTCVWSQAIRRGASTGSAAARELVELIREGRVAMIGAIRQELLSGVRVNEQYRRLRERLRAFEDIPLEAADYEQAAACFNQCRAKGLQGSNTDFLICAVSLRRKLAIFTTDADFKRFSRILKLELHEAR